MKFICVLYLGYFLSQRAINEDNYKNGVKGQVGMPPGKVFESARCNIWSKKSLKNYFFLDQNVEPNQFFDELSIRQIVI